MCKRIMYGTIASNVAEAGFANTCDQRVVTAYTLGRHVLTSEHIIMWRPVAVIAPSVCGHASRRQYE